jgi:hypothetical protein
MRPTDSSGAQLAESTRTTLSEEDIAAIREHLTELLEGSSFSGTQRSAQFLRYVVENALAGRPELLKERAIGAELFGRSPSYGTRGDAIVRVTASEVRKRLDLHYQKVGARSKFQIGIPAGTYSPVFARVPDAQPGPTDPTAPREHPVALGKRAWLWFGVVPGVLVIALAIIFATHHLQARGGADSVLPWSFFFQSSRPLDVITSDPNLAEIAWLTGRQVSVSDYANHIYIPQPNQLTPETERLCRMVLRGDKAALVDMSIVADVAALAGTKSRRIEVQGARTAQLSDLRTDTNFIFLGSPRSNPWTSLFSEELDFRFDFNNDPRVLGEFIRNVKPRAGEQTEYMPTAPGWATGDSFAILAFIPNPDQNGEVLLLQGISAEATKAVGQLATDPPRLSSALNSCGLSSSDALQHFELLLRVNTMAGQPTQANVLACHILGGTSARRY